MTRFHADQLVRATDDVQGLKRGVAYRVTTVNAQETAFGTFVTYTVERATPTPLPAENRPVFVVNGHLFLEAA